MTPEQTSSLFDYMRGIYGRQFTADDTVKRVWEKKLYRFPLELVIRVVDNHVEAANDDFPPNLAKLVKACKTMRKNDNLMDVDSAVPQLEHSMTWHEWAVCMAEKLLVIYEWEPQPVVDYAAIMDEAVRLHMGLRSQFDWAIDKASKVKQETPEFKSIVQKILARTPDYFAEYEKASDCSEDERKRGSVKIFRDIGATKKRSLSDVFQGIPA